MPQDIKDIGMFDLATGDENANTVDRVQRLEQNFQIRYF